MAAKSSDNSGARRSVIITFKPKDKRADQQRDKVDVVREAISTNVRFLNSAEVAPGVGPVSGVGQDLIGFDVNLYEAPIVTASLTEAEVSNLKKNPDVAMVEEDGLCYALSTASLVFEGQPSPLAETVPAGISQVKAPAAWDSSRGKGIRVAVLDTGIDAGHPDLAANVKGAVSFVPGETPADGNGHGTHCAGTIAAAMNGVGVVGVAPAAWLYAVKVLANNGSGNWSWLIAGINWCINNGIKIISMSLGGSGAPAALETMCNTAFNKGLLLIAAAGNSGPGNNTVNVPGKYKNVIAVSAIDNANVIAPFSSRGPEVEICAPGVNVLSTVPGGGYGTKSGTSMACPHVAGGAAVVWGAHRFATNVQIWNLLAFTADNLGPPNWDPNYGYGRLDVDQAALMLVPAPAMALKELKAGA
ncbi:MAG: S8 family peptidase [Bryobacteraceae bacterium]|nr:S8 family peptidase [Bryobacteraceae bacterium]